MRISRLDLISYGCFTETILDLPLGEADLHIVFGPNEAGKSTALSALEDLLFGIPHNSSRNFLHDYASMRVGAVLETDGERLEVRRRKGNKDTLLTAADLPVSVGEGALAPFLDGADRDFFTRMFSLDHVRLRSGGEAILDPNNEIGEILFSAGAGIAGLRERLKALEKEADGLWASRRAAHRRYYQAEDRLKAADGLIREHMVSARKWLDLKRDCDSARERLEDLEGQITVKEAKLRKLNRVRRVHRDVRKKAELDAEIANLSQARLLPEDARRQLDTALQDDNSASTRIQTFTEQLETLREERAGLKCDDRLLLHEVDIKRLHERRIQVQKGKADLPQRRKELADVEEALRRLARELDWPSEDVDRIVKRIPSRSKVADLRTLMGKHGGLQSTLDNAENAREEADIRQSELSRQLADMGTPADITSLAAAVKSEHQHIDIALRIGRAVQDVGEAEAAIRRYLEALRPEVTGEATLASMQVPPRDTVQAHRDLQREWEQRLRDCRDNQLRAQLELDKSNKARDMVARTDQGVPIDELVQARTHRDRGWSLVKRHVEGEPPSEQEVLDFAGPQSSLVDAYETAVHAADGVADRRFDRAEATARLAERSRQIAEQELMIEALRKEETALVEEGETLKAAWLDMWDAASFVPLTPDAMLEWMKVRDEVMEKIKQRDAAARQVEDLRRAETEARQRLLKEMTSLGVQTDALNGQPLAVVHEAAAEVCRRHEQEHQARHKAQEELRRAKADTERKSQAVEKALQALSQWEGQWSQSLDALGLAANATPEAVGAQLDTIDEMRQKAAQADDLRHQRVEKIELDITTFDGEVADTVAAVAPGLAALKTDEAVVELESRMEAAKGIRRQQEDRDKTIAALERKIAESEESRREARNTIRHLQQTAGVEGVDQLLAAIERSERLRALRKELAQVEQALDQGGDGLALEVLREECRDVDLDEVATRESLLTQELSGLRDDERLARDEYHKARDAFEAIGGDDRPARAADDRQVALADMRSIAEQYVRVRTAVLLLRWAIDRFRSRKQAPLLRRAGELFKMLTSGSFNQLGLDFDDQDRVHLTGLRPGGTGVGVSGMSTGTGDQLYLALRLASVEDYLERGNALPFVADNLFINFDDERAAAGFEVLEQLARKTQVVFFTHHWHLVELARAKLGGQVSVLLLPAAGC